MSSIKNLVMLGASIAMLSACSQAPEEERPEVIRPAKLLEVTESSDIKHFNFPAVVEALSAKELTFQITGQVETLNVREGDQVKEGDVIATLVQRNFSNQLQTAQTQYDAALLDYERAERLIKENAIAQTIFDQRLTQLNVAMAQLDTAQKAIEDTVLVSPFEGVVAVKHVEELDTVNPREAIVTLQTVGAAEALVKIPATLVSRSQQIEPIETFIVLDSVSQYKIPARFVASNALADEGSQTIEVRFGFTPPTEVVILPGMTGMVKATLWLSGDAASVGQIAIPLSAIASDTTGQYVWKVNTQTMVVSRQDVEVSTGVGEMLTIESGLEVGEVIVGAGASYLHEGMKIRRL
jgi:RND family efflux transporter MFP subunit